MEAKEVLAWEFGSQVIQRPFDFLINHPKQVKKKEGCSFPVYIFFLSLPVKGAFKKNCQE